ncbi:hypothetical protein HK100_007989 [Physocladia obscura]|uniref:Uncharacterized protein n=1 Tax=Physocladia obscura TaxID=109957 RepID=A0AAD5T4C7_9FUNG|nr:hypothetical protein HK100_007989 [Physocladia obscura]
MTDKYQREWIQAEAKRNALKKKSLTSKTRKILAGGGSNTTSKAIINDKPKRILIVDKDPKTLFKMSKFLKQGPKISSWRNTSTNGHDHRNESSGDEVADARLKKTVKELDEATKEVADMRIHKEIPQVITVNVPVKNEPKVRFSSGRETKPEVGNSKQLNTQIEPSPVTAKKLIAPPGAAPIGWSPSQ